MKISFFYDAFNGNKAGRFLILTTAWKADVITLLLQMRKQKGWTIVPRPHSQRWWNHHKVQPLSIKPDHLQLDTWICFMIWLTSTPFSQSSNTSGLRQAWERKLTVVQASSPMWVSRAQTLSSNWTETLQVLFSFHLTQPFFAAFDDMEYPFCYSSKMKEIVFSKIDHSFFLASHSFVFPGEWFSWGATGVFKPSHSLESLIFSLWLWRNLSKPMSGCLRFPLASHWPWLNGQKMDQIRTG